jgi:hypothetical protein
MKMMSATKSQLLKKMYLISLKDQSGTLTETTERTRLSLRRELSRKCTTLPMMKRTNRQPREKFEMRETFQEEEDIEIDKEEVEIEMRIDNKLEEDTEVLDRVRSEKEEDQVPKIMKIGHIIEEDIEVFNEVAEAEEILTFLLEVIIIKEHADKTLNTISPILGVVGAEAEASKAVMIPM